MATRQNKHGNKYAIGPTLNNFLAKNTDVLYHVIAKELDVSEQWVVNYRSGHREGCYLEYAKKLADFIASHDASFGDSNAVFATFEVIPTAKRAEFDRRAVRREAESTNNEAFLKALVGLHPVVKVGQYLVIDTHAKIEVK